ncbi:DUF262 domain-containing protein [Candidatus Dojkabacteria bacterium]|nr:DUF262 domain-containing protein [Candidatus Dojkabacteria bacterium]MBN2793759.1 DUF262 domain-containing protein [Clostridia bacterium]
MNELDFLNEELEDSDDVFNFDNQKRIINYESLNPDIKTLYDNWKTGDLLLQPEYQRNFVWDAQKASNLIESILLKIPIPIIYTSEDDEKEEVIDGQQRLTSIFSYIDGEFPDGNQFKLKKLKILSELSGKSFKELDEKIQKAIFKRGLSLIKISENSNNDIKFEMFERLNTNITRLNAQELRNCMYRGSYNGFIKEMSKNNDFQKILNKPEYSKRMLDSELILMFFSFYDTNFIQFRGNMKQFLNEDMRKNKNINDNEMRKLTEVFKKSVDLVKTIFGEKAFRTYSIDKNTKKGTFDNRKLNQGLFLILMYGFIPYNKNQIIPYADLIREELLSLQIHNMEFIDSLTGSGTNSRDKIYKKISIWENSLRNIIGYPIGEKRAFSKKLKETLFEQSNKCKICGNEILDIDDAEVDHIICYWEGGKTIPENAQLTHRICNRIKNGTSST